MTKPWRIHAEALAEIDRTSAWYDEQRPGLGVEFVVELRAVLVSLRDAPGLSTPDRSSPAAARVRRRRLHRFPYAVVFAESDTEYVVIAAMHLRRRPGYWLTRLVETE